VRDGNRDLGKKREIGIKDGEGALGEGGERVKT